MGFLRFTYSLLSKVYSTDNIMTVECMSVAITDQVTISYTSTSHTQQYHHSRELNGIARMTAKHRLEKQTCHAVPCPCRTVLVMHRFLSPESKLRNAPSKNIFPGRPCFPPTPLCNVCERAPPTCLVSRVCKDPCIKT